MYPTEDDPAFGCFVRDQVDDLRALGAKVTVLAFDGRSDRTRYAAAGLGLLRTVRRHSFDVVHAHYGLTGAIAALQRHAPVVTTFHGGEAWVPWQRKVSRVVARRTHPIAVTSGVAASLGVKDATVIPCAVDLDLFRPMDRGEARNDLGWPREGLCVLFPAARDDETKITRKQVRLFDEVVGVLQARVTSVIARSLDGLSRRGVVCAMNAADVTVMTSLWEGSPVAVKESLACGTPVVSVPVGDVPDTISGLPGCAIVSRDPRALAAAVEQSFGAERHVALRHAMQAYGRECTAARVLDVYTRIVQQGRRR
jgi:glycosyltransferase involved in cell wall biosynthesis